MIRKQEHNGIWKILGKRWTLSILSSMGSKEIVRFGELKRALAGISSTTLSERLRQLERKGLVAKKIYGSMPPRVEYSLTASATELGAIMGEIGSWHARWKSSAYS